MEGNRKFIITALSLVVYGGILFFAPNIDPANLGLGLGFLIAPNAVGNIFEHKYKGSVKSK